MDLCTKQEFLAKADQMRTCHSTMCCGPSSLSQAAWSLSGDVQRSAIRAARKCLVARSNEENPTKKMETRKATYGSRINCSDFNASIPTKNVKQTGLSLVQKAWCARVPLSFRLLSSLTKMDIRGIRNPWKYLRNQDLINMSITFHDCPWYSHTLVPATEKRTREGIRRSLSNPGTHLLFPSVKREEWGGTSNTKREERNWETSSWKEDEGEEKDNDENGQT